MAHLDVLTGAVVSASDRPGVRTTEFWATMIAAALAAALPLLNRVAGLGLELDDEALYAVAGGIVAIYAAGRSAVKVARSGAVGRSLSGSATGGDRESIAEVASQIGEVRRIVDGLAASRAVAGPTTEGGGDVVAENQR